MNGLYIIIILLIFLTGGTGYGIFKVLTNDLHDRKEEKAKDTEARIQQAVSNKDLANALNKLTEVVDKKLQAR